MHIPTHEQQRMPLFLTPKEVDAARSHTIARHSLHAVTPSSDFSWQAASRLTSAYGYNSVAAFALDPKKQLFFSGTGHAFISYMLQGDVVLAIGDPIGPPHELPLALTEFLAFWRARHKALAFWQAREELLELYRSQRLHTLKIGEDAIIDVQNFTLKGGKMANVRTSAKRAEKAGVHVIFYKGTSLPSLYNEQMERISRTWLAHKGGHEMGFSMGRFEQDAATEHCTALAFDPSGIMQAFVTFVPIPGRNGWGLDLLRRDGQAVPGTMELLLARSLECFQALGTATVSLGLAPLSDHNQSRGSLLDRSCSLLLRRLGKFQQYDGLIAFKQKFQPTWENRYLIYSHPAHLLSIGLALDTVHQQP